MIQYLELKVCTFFVLMNSAAKVNNQLFDTKEALDLHLKYLHDPKKVNPNVEE